MKPIASVLLLIMMGCTNNVNTVTKVTPLIHESHDIKYKIERVAVEVSQVVLPSPPVNDCESNLCM